MFPFLEKLLSVLAEIATALFAYRSGIKSEQERAKDKTIHDINTRQEVDHEVSIKLSNSDSRRLLIDKWTK